MTARNRWQTLAGFLLVSAFVLSFLTPAAMAQEKPENPSEQTVTQTSTTPPPPPKPGPDPGPFKKGKVRVGFYAGAGSTLDRTYFIIGGGLGYYVVNGLEAGLDVEGWVLESPSFWKVTPQVRYVFWQLNPIRPYVGAFWRKTFSGGDYADFNSYGGRGGVAYRRGGSYVALGVVYEKYDNYKGLGDDYSVYPEIAFWLSF
jgi:hypothetical protein